MKFLSVTPGLSASRRLAFRSGRRSALTLVEVVVAMFLLTAVLLGFIGSFIQSRRITETSVMHAAATSFVYGVVEQIKSLDYTTLVPSTTVDSDAPSTSSPPYIRVRINQDQVVWLQCVYTTAGATPQAPTTTPGPTVTATSLSAIDNVVGPLPLSSVTGTKSQALTINLWVWVDEMPSISADVMDVKRVTIVYTYQVNDGQRLRTIRDREVFIRTRFDL